MNKLSTNEWVGNCDLPSIWNQAKRANMWLHWDGNNNSVEERNRSAAFGTGAVPRLLDRESLTFIANWLRSDANQPPKYPFEIDAELAERGKPLYAEYCAACHGANGRDFSGRWVGKVEPIDQRHQRLGNVTAAIETEMAALVRPGAIGVRRLHRHSGKMHHRDTESTEEFFSFRTRPPGLLCRGFSV